MRALRDVFRVRAQNYLHRRALAVFVYFGKGGRYGFQRIRSEILISFDRQYFGRNGGDNPAGGCSCGIENIVVIHFFYFRVRKRAVKTAFKKLIVNTRKSDVKKYFSTSVVRRYFQSKHGLFPERTGHPFFFYGNQSRKKLLHFGNKILYYLLFVPAFFYQSSFGS